MCVCVCERERVRERRARGWVCERGRERRARGCEGVCARKGGGVGGAGEGVLVCEGGVVGCRLLTEVVGEVDGLEERLSLDLVRAVPPQAILVAAAQFNYQVRSLRAQLGLRGDVKRCLPVYHLETSGKYEGTVSRISCTVNTCMPQQPMTSQLTIIHLELGFQRRGC